MLFRSPQVSAPTSQELTPTTPKTPESQLLVIVQAAGIRDLARATTPEIRELLADLSCGLTKATALAAPKIFQLTQTLGHKDVLKLLLAILRAFVDSVRVPSKPDAADLMELAETLAQTYTHDSLKDILLALKEARMGGIRFYQALDVATLYELTTAYFERKADYLHHRHRDTKATAPGREAAAVQALAAAAPAILTMVARRIDPHHPNAAHLRQKLTITRQRERRGLITPAQAEAQRREVEAANHHAAARPHRH